MKKPTLQDVADLAKVSKATVSRYLHNYPRMSERTRASIQAAIKQTGYRADPMVSQFLSGVRRRNVGAAGTVLGWLNTYPTKDYWSGEACRMPLLEGVRERAAESGFGLDEFWLAEPGMTPARLQEILLTRGIRALIVPPGSRILEVFPDFDWSPFAVVSVNPSVRDQCPWHSVGTDSLRNGSLLYHELRKAGYEKIGLVLPRAFSSHEGHGMLGRLLLEPLVHPFPCPPRPFIHREGLLEPDTRQRFAQWLDTECPDVIVCLDSRMRTLLAELGRQVPGDIGLAHVNLGADVIDWSGLSRNSAEKGRAAVDLLAMQLGQNHYGFPPEPRQLMIAGHWAQGTTTRRPE